MNSKRVRRLKYPLDQITVGKALTMSAECASEFAKMRVAACTYGKRAGIKLHCSVQADGSLRIWRDSQVSNNQPTQFEFVSYLATMANGQSFTLGSDYSERFEQLTDWVHEFAAEARINFVVEEVAAGMKVTRQDGA
jgi:hypothetical protein